MNKKDEYVRWVKSFDTGRQWLEAVEVDKSGSLKTQRNYAYCLKRFCDFCQKTPEELIAERKVDLKSEDEDEAVRNKAENMLRRYLLEIEKTIARVSADYHYNAVKSFYRYNYVPLRIKRKVAKIRRPGLTIDEFKEIYAAADERERAILAGLKDSGMSREDFVRLTYGHVRRELEVGNQFIHLNAERQKAGVRGAGLPYETYLGPNAVETLKTLLTIRRNRGEKITDDSPLYGTMAGTPYTPDSLSVILNRLGHKIGIPLSTKRVRKMFETYMAITVRHPVVLKYWMGHVITGDIEAHYIIPPEPEQRKLYMEAYKSIDITPRPDEYEIFKAEIKARLETMVPEQRSRFMSEIFTLYHLRAARLLEEADIKALLEGKKKREPYEIELNEEDCQQVIDESEIEEYLKRGFKYVATLSNGKVIVER